ncbi:TetR/AcrR family transcriptional regulator [[Mycobacterium] nativiensis]|uniref:TetR/AcrR family transcriptional regulator n=1 Tax=[Mycobacterium] nativiensis TaxID=2855503 RepID=A0ABU5Y2Y6_9MYCO|nr:TetR/AcrR family transcriptional regulator [Mycolicibacter sp. MYC340]MEB3034407.1 TetR/AcrR family transcriptional regulator [Mycolicibacter sp. MYC340]
MSAPSASPQPRKQERGTAAQRKMVEAAQSLIAEGGFSHATMARIGERAGYSRGLADYHFASKSEIVEKIIEEIAHGWDERIQSAEPRRGMPALAHAIEVAMIGLETDPAASRVLQVLASEAPSLEPAIQQLLARHDESYRRRLRRWIVEAQQDGTARPDIDPVAASVAIEGMLRGVGYQWMLNPDALRPTAMVPTLRDAVLGLIGRPAGLWGPLPDP